MKGRAGKEGKGGKREDRMGWEGKGQGMGKGRRERRRGREGQGMEGEWKGNGRKVREGKGRKEGKGQEGKGGKEGKGREGREWKEGKQKGHWHSYVEDLCVSSRVQKILLFKPGEVSSQQKQTRMGKGRGHMFCTTSSSP